MDAQTRTVTLASGRTFAALPGLSLVDAAAANGLVLEHGCRTGRCGACKATVTAGTTARLQDEPSLTADERAAGTILTCCHGVGEGDLALDAEDLGLPPELVQRLSPRVLPARIDALEAVAPDVLKVTLRLPPAQPLPFLAGQYVDLTNPKGLRRSYSLAQSPEVTGRLELHVRRLEGGAMSAWWFGEAKANDLVRLRGPLGTCFLRETAGLDLVFLATGTGLAPIRSMLLQLAALADPAQRPRSVSLYWGHRVAADLYIDPLAGLGPDPAVSVVPVRSRADAAWTGAPTRVVACGSPAMIDAARSALVAAGLDPRHFRSDAFVAS